MADYKLNRKGAQIDALLDKADGLVDIRQLDERLILDENHKLKVNLEGMASEEDLVWEKGTGENSIQQKGSLCEATGENAVAKGMNTHAGATGSSAEGALTATRNDYDEKAGTGFDAAYSHAEGLNNGTNNIAEHAEGKFGWSYYDENHDPAKSSIHYVGVGTNNQEEYRKDAEVIMNNGDKYILGIGNYDGKNLEGAKPVQEVVGDIEEAIENKADKLEVLPISAYGFDTNIVEKQMVAGSALVDKVLASINEDKKQVIIKAGDYKFQVIGTLQPDRSEGYRGFAIETLMLDPAHLETAVPQLQKCVFLYVEALDKTINFYGYDYAKEEIDGIVAQVQTMLGQIQAAISAEAARAQAAEGQVLVDAKAYTDQEVAKVKSIKYEIVAELPEAGAEYDFNVNKTVYLLHEGAGKKEKDYFGEYICLNKGTEEAPEYAWEKIGDTRIDLSNYYTKSETEAKIAEETERAQGQEEALGMSINGLDDRVQDIEGKEAGWDAKQDVLSTYEGADKTEGGRTIGKGIIITSDNKIARDVDIIPNVDYVDQSISNIKAYFSQEITNEHNGRVAGDELLQAAVDKKQDILTAGANITIVKDEESGTTTISATGGGAVSSVNGMTGTVVLTGDDMAVGIGPYSDLTVGEAINTLNNAVENKQDQLTAGANIYITGDTISAVDTKPLLTKPLIAGYTIGGITEGTVIAAGTPIEDVLAQLFYKESPEEGPELYVGFTPKITFKNFTNLTTAQLLEYVVAEKLASETPYNYITENGDGINSEVYYIMVRDDCDVSGGKLVSGGLTTNFTAADIKGLVEETAWRAQHSDISVGNHSYTIYGLRTMFNANDSMEITIIKK